jgi:hypothetical protein
MDEKAYPPKGYRDNLEDDWNPYGDDNDHWRDYDDRGCSDCGGTCSGSGPYLCDVQEWAERLAKARSNPLYQLAEGLDLFREQE